MKIKIFVLKNQLLILVASAYIILALVRMDMAVQSIQNSMYYVIEMLEIMPVVFILTALIETWVPKQFILNSFGERAGVKGALFSFVLGSFSAGPIYAAFPICKMLIRKGATIFNIVIILSAWAVIKVPMLANEAKFLGLKFMGLRWILTSLSILSMAYFTSFIVSNKDIPNSQEDIIGNKTMIVLQEDICIGCGLCARASSEHFKMEGGKAKVIISSINKASTPTLEHIITRCPAKSINWAG